MCWDHVFLCWGSCIYVLGVMYLCVGGHAFVCWGSCISVLGVMYLCVGVMHLCVPKYMTHNTEIQDPQHKYMTPTT
jgi:hypothetical protein